MDGRVLDFFALGILVTVAIVLLYAVIGIHDIPYEISKKRNHPHQDAIHAAGWISLFLMHALWPFLWVWAMLYKPERGWGMVSDDSKQKGGIQASPFSDESIQELAALKARVAALEQKLEPAIEQKTESAAEEV